MQEELLIEKIKTCIESYKDGEKYNISSIMFFTYQFDSEFFETQLITRIFNINDFISNSRYLANRIEKEIQGIDIKVFYEKLLKQKKCFNYYAKVVNNPNGVFHPKLIVIKGKRKNKTYTTILSMSANITIAGYASNQEVVGIIEKQVDIDIENLNDYKDIFNKILEQFPELIITGIEKNISTNNIKNELEKSEKISVITPFLSSKIVDIYCEKGKEIEIIFTNLKGLKKDDIKGVGDCIEKYKNLHIYLYNGERKIHEKIYLLTQQSKKQKLIIGSHNFTYNSINGQNVEASIITDKFNKEIKTYFQNLEKESSELKSKEEVKKLVNENYENDREEKNIYISNAIIDWENCKLSIEITSLNADNKISQVEILQLGEEIFKDIKLEKNKDFIENNKEKYEVYFGESRKVIQAIKNNKYFELLINNNIICEGLFNEENRIEEEILIGNDYYENLLEFWRTGEDKVEANEIDSDIEEEIFEINEQEQLDSDINRGKYDIVKMFLTYKTINERIDNITESQKLKHMYKIADYSIYQLIDTFIKLLKDEIKLNTKNSDEITKYSIKKLDDNKLLYFLLTCNELDLLIKKYNEKLKNDYIDNKIYSIYNIIKQVASSRIEISKNNIKKSDILEAFLKNLK